MDVPALPALAETPALAPPADRPSRRARDVLALTVDLVSAVACPWTSDALRAAFAVRRGVNALVPALALVCFSLSIVLVRRLPHDRDAFTPDPSISHPRSWAAMSTLLGTCTMLIAMAHVSIVGGGTLPGWVAWLGSWVVAAVLFTPLALLWVGQPAPIAGRGRRLRAEALLLVLCDATSLILVGCLEWLMLDVQHSGKQGPLPPVALVGLVVLVPTFLLLCGAPRLLLLVRRFSWLGLLSLLASTSWYFVDGFFR